ncbi:hypothetical protein BaRGS_00003183 [Batillaria attramentaria]|uniref:Uncharacterized protein n=1 Tax=Batillaria attramentaria TaxID=370345 RepID=A0ABD0M221_9CAEN
MGAARLGSQVFFLAFQSTRTDQPAELTDLAMRKPAEQYRSSLIKCTWQTSRTESGRRRTSKQKQQHMREKVTVYKPAVASESRTSDKLVALSMVTVVVVSVQSILSSKLDESGNLTNGWSGLVLDVPWILQSRTRASWVSRGRGRSTCFTWRSSLENSSLILCPYPIPPTAHPLSGLLYVFFLNGFAAVDPNTTPPSASPYSSSTLSDFRSRSLWFVVSVHRLLRYTRSVSITRISNVDVFPREKSLLKD